MTEHKYTLQLGDKTLQVELGGLADQASGCCLVKLGDTSVLATAQAGEEKPEMGFFPLTCDYEEKFYAAGKILGSRFVRREGRPSTNAVLTGRMIDRAVRPLFSQNLTREVQCIATCLSWDTANDPGVLGLVGVSLALGLSEIPFFGLLSAVRVAKVGDEFILNPNYEQREQACLDIVFAAIEEKGEVLVNMIDGKGNEATEEDVLLSLDFAQKELKALLAFQAKIIKKHGKEKLVFAERATNPELEARAQKFWEGKLEKAMYQKNRKQSKDEVKALEKELLEIAQKEFGSEYLETAKALSEKYKEKILSENILEREKRPDARSLDEVREISCEVAVLPRTHGSAVFNRGETRILSILTLGAPGDQQLFEEMEFSGKKRFLHHYNFPPYSVGEVKRLAGPGRREIGHGMLAEKALLPLLPGLDDFPYTIRVVSEALSSNGSTSMASVSAASLALMDAGVPLKRPAAGIAIGIIKNDSKSYKLLTDIQGPEDSLGDMDFKVAGTEKGITALQMDVKTDGLNKEIMSLALERAKKARLFILAKMAQTIKEPRKELSPFAPRVYILQINPDKIGAVIGTGGKVINEIIEKCNVAIDIEDTGQVYITAQEKEGAERALEWVQSLTKEFKVGEICEGKVVKITDFGAFVELSPGQDGLVHISELAPFRVERVTDVLQEGDKIPVKVINIDDQGKISLSARQAGFTPRQTAQGSVLPKQKQSSSPSRPFFKRRGRA